MKLNELKNKSSRSKKRLGRGIGSSKGKTSGRGHKGQKSRSGVAIKSFEGGQMPLHRRLPMRGFSNSLFKKSFQIVNVAAIEKLNETDINGEVLKSNGLVRSALQPIKILANGELTRKVNVTASAFSDSAKGKIEKAGGSVTVQ